MVKLAAVIETIRPMLALASLMVKITAAVGTIGTKAACHSDKHAITLCFERLVGLFPLVAKGSRYKLLLSLTNASGVLINYSSLISTYAPFISTCSIYNCDANFKCSNRMRFELRN